MSPTTLHQFLTGQVLVVRGDTFAQNSQIEVQGSALTTQYFGPGELHVTVPVELINFQQQLSVRVATSVVLPDTFYGCDGVFTSYSSFLYVTVQ